MRYVIAVFNQDVGIEPTLAGALSDVLGANISGITSGGTGPGTGTGGTGTTPSNATAAAHLTQASADYQAALKALASGSLGEYQHDVEAMNHQLELAQSALGSS